MNYTKEQCENKISKWEKRLEDCNKLKVGNWYKDGKALVYCNSLFDNDIIGYGFSFNGNWHSYNEVPFMGGNWALATDKEVEDALIKEAKRREFKEGVDVKWHSLDEVWRNSQGKFHYCKDMNSLYFGNYSIFEDGKWADIIEEPVYEYQWLVSDDNNTRFKTVTPSYYTSSSEASLRVNGNVYNKIEETKRIRKSWL